MENTFIIDISEEQANYLQRLGMEVDSKIFIIDRLFTNHMQDDTTELFNSIPYKYYMQEYEKTFAAWETAKQSFEKNIVMPAVQQKTGLENPNFSWQINDYSSLKCKITLL